MRHMLMLMLTCYFSIAFSYGQTKPAKEKPPTKKELLEMQKEMQQSMDEMTEEEKKEMEKMGIKMPDLKTLQKTIAGVSDKQLKQAWEDDNRIVPKKDDNRIAKALSINLSNSDMAAFVSKTQQEVLLKLSADTKATGQILLQAAKTQKKSVAYSAIGLWIDGKPTLALYLMGEAAKENPTNANNLNNYAAMLSMCGAEQLALPILNNINKRYPKNSSILNNITQAWLGLGDIDKADKYADSTIRIAAFHPQANMAKCLIEESKGNIPAAVAAGKKAIKKSFSIQKQNKLESLGYKLKPEDLSWDKPMPQDPMGLEKFVWPDYPANVDQSMILEKKWDAFKVECFKKLDELQNKLEKVEKDREAIKEKRTALAMQGKADPQAMPYPLSAVKAMIKLSYLIAPDYGPNMTFIFAKEFEGVMLASKKLEAFKEIRNTKNIAFGKKYEDLFGEGKSNPFDAACSEDNGIRNNYLASSNEVLQKANNSYINSFRRKASDHLYYIQYTMWPEDFELAKINAQIAWLEFIAKQPVEFLNKSSYCQPKKVKDSTGTLQNFDDVACKYTSKMEMGLGSITQQCSNITLAFDFGGLKIDLKENNETNKMDGTVIIGISKGFDGPMGTEIETSAGAKIDFDKTGITDVGAIVGAEVTVAGQTVIGAEATITINSGTSVSGKGILQGANK